MDAAVPTPRGLRSCEIRDEAIHLVLDNSIDAIEAGRTRVLAFLKDHTVDGRAINRIEVIFEEVVSNVIRHGFEPGSGQTIRIRIADFGPAMELAFEDDGTPFDPLAAAEPERPGSLAEARLGGLGIPLLRRLTETIRYERPDASDGDGHFAPTNRLVLTIATQPSPSAP